MSQIKRYLVELSTSWYGEDQTYAAICDDEHMYQLELLAGLWSYENFESFSGFSGVLENLFGTEDEDELTEEELEEACQEEGSFYSYYINEYTGTDEDWEDYKIWYDCTEE